MDLQAGLAELARLLDVAARALERMASAEAENNCSPAVAQYIKEVEEVASQLKKLSARQLTHLDQTSRSSN